MSDAHDRYSEEPLKRQGYLRYFGTPRIVRLGTRPDRRAVVPFAILLLVVLPTLAFIVDYSWPFVVITGALAILCPLLANYPQGRPRFSLRALVWMLSLAVGLTAMYLSFAALLAYLSDTADIVIALLAVGVTALLGFFLTANATYWARPTGRSLGPSDVLARERQWISERRIQTVPATAPDTPRFGLAISGGGVRAASVAAGFLETLFSKGVAPKLDYVSVVSGGSWLPVAWHAAARQRKPVDGAFFPRLIRSQRKYLPWQSVATAVLGTAGRAALWVFLAMATLAAVMVAIETLRMGCSTPACDWAGRLYLWLEDLAIATGSPEEALSFWRNSIDLSRGAAVVAAGAGIFAVLCLLAAGGMALFLRHRLGWQIVRAPAIVALLLVFLASLVFASPLAAMIVVAFIMAPLVQSNVRVLTTLAFVTLSLFISYAIVFGGLSATAGLLAFHFHKLLSFVMTQFDSIIALLGFSDPLKILIILLIVPVAAIVAWLRFGGVRGLFSFFERTIARAFIVPTAGGTLPMAAAGPRQGEPLLIINTAAHIPGAPADVASRRGTARFEFSPVMVGGPATGWVEANSFPNGLNLSEALAASSAAISSQAGVLPRGLQSFLRFSGLHLGRWIPNPALRNDPRWQISSWITAGLDSLSSIFGANDDEQQRVFVAEGGFYDNLGLVALVERGVETIICVDAIDDPRLEFVDLDYAIEALASSGWLIPPKNHPARHISDGPVFELSFESAIEKKTCRVVYVKTMMTNSIADEFFGALRVYIDSSTAFPHNATFVQWYSRVQMNAYIRLGHILGSRAVAALGQLPARSPVP